MIPKDPVILLSYLNTQLRDYYSTLDEMCKALDLDEKEIVETMKAIGYVYVVEHNQFK